MNFVIPDDLSELSWWIKWRLLMKQEAYVKTLVSEYDKAKQACDKSNGYLIEPLFEIIEVLYREEQILERIRLSRI